MQESTKFADALSVIVAKHAGSHIASRCGDMAEALDATDGINRVAAIMAVVGYLQIGGYLVSDTDAKLLTDELLTTV